MSEYQIGFADVQNHIHYNGLYGVVFSGSPSYQKGAKEAFRLACERTRKEHGQAVLDKVLSGQYC